MSHPSKRFGLGCLLTQRRSAAGVHIDFSCGENCLMRPYNTSKRTLVTGGAGFLGSHLCDRLIEQGHDVLCVDNMFTGSKRNTEQLLGNPRFEFMRHDVTFPLYVEVD